MIDMKKRVVDLFQEIIFLDEENCDIEFFTILIDKDHQASLYFRGSVASLAGAINSAILRVPNLATALAIDYFNSNIFKKEDGPSDGSVRSMQPINSEKHRGRHE